MNNPATKVFLGGTCNESTWRSEMIIHLRDEGIRYFDPVVDNWTEDCMAREIQERQNCAFCLYTITPKMTGVYSIAKVVDDSNKRPEKTILVLLRDDHGLRFTEGQWKSLKAVAKMVHENGSWVFDDLKSAAVYIGKISREK